MNYRSFNEGILQLENECPWPRTSCWMLAAWDRACVASCFSSLARPETSTRRLERAGSHLDPITPGRTVQDSYPIMWCDAIRELLPSWVRIWRTTRWQCRLDYRNRDKSAHQTLESVASNSMVDGSKTAELLVVQRVPHEAGNHWKLLLHTELWGKLGPHIGRNCCCCLVLANSATIGNPFIPRIPWMVSELLSPSYFRTVGSKLLVDRTPEYWAKVKKLLWT